jgi:hypothetical protein
MFEMMLTTAFKLGLPDNSDLPFPSGTPFQGVVSASNFITGTALASAISLTQGTGMNSDAGWLHFIEDNGLELYIAKKPLRYNVTWEEINVRQKATEVTIGGEVYVVKFLTGMTAPNLMAAPANRGGQWNRYIYNVYGGPYKSSLPAGTLNWGPYSESMLGIYTAGQSQENGGLCLMAEPVTQGGHATRGVSWTDSSDPNIMGLWYITPNTPRTWYGWRPVLFKKSTLPPTPYKGLVAGASLITPSALSTLAGYTSGTLMDDATPWMHFIEDNGKEVYVAQRSFRDKCTRASLNTAGIGNTANGKTLTIGGKQYKCRLLTEAEWNRYMYGVYGDTYTTVNTLEWASFNDAQLGVCAGGVIAGGLSHTFDGTTRGFTSIAGAWQTNDGSPGTSGYAWRPILELIP